MDPLSPDAWNARYLDQDTPWDLSGPTPELERLLSTGALGGKGRALVPGGGRGYDAILLAKAGFTVDLVDFAPAALEAAKALAGDTNINFTCADFFALAESQTYDLFWEYTFFCAIDPALRAAYAQKVHNLLRSGASFWGLFFPLSIDKDGPPFRVSEAEIRKLFGGQRDFSLTKPERSVKPRAGRELLVHFKI